MKHLGLSGEFKHDDKKVSFLLDMYVFKEGNSFIVYSPALDMSAYGNTSEEAQKAFEDIIESSFKYSLNKNTFKEDLQKHGWKITSLKQKKIKAPSVEELMKHNDCFKDIINNKDYTRYKKDILVPELV
ncbi:hypothetical protein LJC21_00825 [Bacteroides sp. OttesenSCG-928-E20]|nr:hypothetical protein [Bacteroides sp. OttesenSCG-928-E20]